MSVNASSSPCCALLTKLAATTVLVQQLSGRSGGRGFHGAGAGVGSGAGAGLGWDQEPGLGWDWEQGWGGLRLPWQPRVGSRAVVVGSEFSQGEAVHILDLPGRVVTLLWQQKSQQR